MVFSFQHFSVLFLERTCWCTIVSQMLNLNSASNLFAWTAWVSNVALPSSPWVIHSGVQQHAKLISIYSPVQVPAGQLNCWALFRDCVGVSCMYELFKLGMLLSCKSLLQIWSIGWEVFGETLSWLTPTRTTTNWPPIILGLPSLFLEMSVCQLMYHGISILICPNMLCAM